MKCSYLLKIAIFGAVGDESRVEAERRTRRLQDLPRPPPGLLDPVHAN
jgi:hypothetical protein